MITLILFKVLPILFGLFIIYKFFILALMRLHPYKKQGLHTEFSPILGSFLINIQMNQKKHDDPFYDIIKLAEEKPDLKAIVRNFGATPVLCLLDPAIKKEFAFNHNMYEIGDFFGNFAKVFTRGLVGVEGDNWKKQRKIISQSFHFEFLRENVPIILNTTHECLDDIVKGGLQGVKTLYETEKLGAEIIGRVFFSAGLKNYTLNGKSVSTQVMNILTNTGKAFMSLGYLFFGPKYIEKALFQSHKDLINEIKGLESTCQRILDDRKNSKTETKDLAWYLLESQKSPNPEDRLTDEEIVANYVTFITVRVLV